MRVRRDIIVYQIIEAHLIMSSEAVFAVSVYRAARKESVPRSGLYGMPFPVLRNNIRRIVAFFAESYSLKTRKHFARILFYDS
jgi:hypothetical protein